MRSEHWIVSKPSGEEWGIIKRLIIDSVTKQITHADMIVGDTGNLVRVSWQSFNVEKERIILSVPDGRGNTPVVDPSLSGLGESVTMEVWP